MFAKRINLWITLFLFMALLSGLMPSLIVQADVNFDSLYAAVEAANRSGSGSITLTADITLSAALPPVTGTIAIDGGGYTISGDNSYQIFMVDGGDLTIKDLTLTEGKGRNGGAILLQNGATAIVENASFKNNEARWGGAIATDTGNDELSVQDSVFIDNSVEHGGGAIFVNGGSVTISGSSFGANTAGNGGGAMETLNGRVDVTNSTFYDNFANDGGGVHVSGAQLTMTHVTMLDNEAKDSGDGFYKRDGGLELRNSIVAGDGDGYDCTGGLDLSRGNFSQDGTCASMPGGDPMLAEMTGSPGHFPLLDGSPAVDAADASFCLQTDQIGNARPLGGGCDIGAFESATASPAEPTPAPVVCSFSDQILAANTNTAVGACPAGTSHDIISLTEDITLSGLLPVINGTITIEGNGFTISGDNRFPIFIVGGRTLTIKNLTLTDAVSAEDGGAILVQSGAELVVENATFADNESRKGGGAISTGPFSVGMSISNSVFKRNQAQSGGGAILVNGGNVDISGSSFQDNVAGRFGGGVEAFVGRVSITNSTFNGNEAGEAGGIFVSGATTTMTHLTLMDNQALWGEGDGIHRREGLAYLRNSIVAGGGSAIDCSGGLSESTGNFSQDGSCALLPGGDPMLGELTGSPGHFPLLDGSPVVDAADAATCLATDQAGKPRPVGGGCDIGAIEWGIASEAQTATVLGVQTSAACSVTTTHVLNFRDAPNGERIGAVQANTTLVVIGSASGWFNVEHSGTAGWISGDYVTTEGDCS